jgi:cellulose biosynthesis protein BcsQ
LERILKIKIGIIICEEKYGTKLGEYLSGINSSLDIFISQKSMDLKEMENILSSQDIAIVDDINQINNYSKLSKETKLKFIFLTENLVQLEKYNSENFILIKKYESVKNINLEIEYLNLLINGSMALIPKRQNVKVYVVTSGAGGTGKSSIAICLSRDLSKRYSKKILYFNMESFQIYDSYFTEMPKGKRNISDFLYYLFKKSDLNKNSQSTKSYIYTDSFGVNVFYPSEGHNDLSELNIEEIKFVLDELCQSKEYDYIIVDLGIENLETLYFLYNYSNNLLQIYDKSNFTQNKNVILTDLIKKNSSENPTDKILKIFNKIEFDDFIQEERLFIENDPSSFRKLDNKIDISYHGNFFAGIRNITDYLIKKE